MSRGKILVIRGGAIGDFILTLPALAALRKTFPQTRLEVLGYPHIASLASLAGYTADVKSIEAGPLAGFFARRGTLNEALAEYFAGFNIIISYLYDPDGVFQENIARCSKAQFIAGPHRPSERDAIHATEVFLKPLERLAIFDADPVPRIPVPHQTAGGTLAVHPGSGGEKKNWGEERWTELLTRVANDTNCPVLMIGGEAEQERVQRLSSLIPIQRLTVVMHQPLPEVARRLASCRAFLGHDSGITHLAAAVGLPGVALWAESNESVWRPRSERFELVCAGAKLRDLPSKEVFAAVQRMMG
ncbi:MAG TPA: glycosyltransferase family 9 protein [Candidatus Acidoferrum sp.]|nr:glycosyltransferase family 9 protein [Candidatus Acidoferrum sp.]